MNELTLEQRAHDIAIAVLPQMIEAEKLDYIVTDTTGEEVFNRFDITDLYQMIYEDLLRELSQVLG